MANLVEKLLAKAASRGAGNLDLEAFAPVIESLITSLGGRVQHEEQWAVGVDYDGEVHYTHVLDRDAAERFAPKWKGTAVKRTVTTTVIPSPWEPLDGD